jgi:hypothetical protein
MPYFWRRKLIDYRHITLIMMKKFLIFLFLTQVMITTAFAARPFVTDDARLTTAGSCQVESWTRIYRHSTEVWSLPACNPTGNVEVTLGAGRVTFNDPLLDSSNDYIFQAKTLLRPLKINDFGVGLAVGSVRHPSINIGPNQLGNTYLYIPVSISMADDKFILHLNSGLLHDRASASNRATWGTGAEINAISRLMFVAEMFGDSTGTSFWQTGVRYGIVPDLLQIDTTIGKQLGGSTDSRWISFGVRFTPAKIF